MSSAFDISSPVLQSPTVLLLSFAGALICHKVAGVYQSIKAVNFHPGRTFLLSPATVLSNFILPKIPGIAAGKNFLHVQKYSEFEELGCSIYRITCIWPTVETVLVLADAAAIKEVTSSRTRFPKPIEVYGSLAFFGRNIVVSEGDEWKKYRKISAPAFSERNNKLVWDETVDIMEDLFRDVWGEKESVTVDNALDITFQLALFVIGSAGFGKHMSWHDSKTPPPGHKLTFKEALHRVAVDIFVKLAVPNWAMGLTERTRQAQLSFEELERYILEMIQERREGGLVERHDLFTNLLESNNLDAGPNAMQERELVGNIFIFLIAGHETTAHTLCFTLAFLALYQEEQEKLYNDLKSVLADGRKPQYEDRTKLNRFLAAIYETMRIITPVTNVPKYSAEDTTLTGTNAQGEKVVIPVPKGTNIAIDAAGLHHNPQYWETPYEYRPDRFLGDYNRDAFLPFSGGARSCIGRKFSESEGVAALAMLISKYKITIKEEPQFAHETFEQRRERILDSKAGITVTPIRVPLVLTRRD